jgi:hypothetical protein
MTNPERRLRKFFKRHGEALFIIAFLLADCFLSGWALTAGTLAAIVYVVMPAISNMVNLSAAGRITYLKAFVKTAKVQKLVILLFWLYSIRWLLYITTSSRLFMVNENGQLPSISSALVMGTQQFAPLAFLASPILIYIAACFLAILLRSRLKATKQDPDLIAQRQRWAGASQFLFVCAYVGSILSITLNAKGPAYMLSNWLLASARDANIFDSPAVGDSWPFTPSALGYQPPTLQAVDTSRVFSDLAFLQPFDTFIITTCSLAAFLLLLQPTLRLTAFLTSFCWRVVSPTSLQNIIEGFLEALRLRERSLDFKEPNPFLSNAVRTLAWLVACYAGLFWLFGFCGGPLGLAIQNWMIASAVDAGLGPSTVAPDWLFQPNFRIFLGSIVALYGTAPIAVTASVILPFAKARKLTLNCDGLSFFQGPHLGLWGRQTRLWSDLKSMTVKSTNKPNSPLRAEFTLNFRSGGRVKFNNSQVSAQDLRVLLDAIDQHAVACSVSPEVFSLCQTLEETAKENAASDGIDDPAIACIPKQEFKSTIFVPFNPGEYLPSTHTRIIKQLASKPLCAVYLARDAEGRMLTVKQFYLADETDETKAFAKILRREYELLSRLDHPGIAKVLTSFTVDHSTYLVIEHRPGSDLRDIVKEHGARSESLTISWAEQLSEIMIYLHSREPAILHRDLTPDNVIAGEDGQLRLIDFGAAREFLEGITGTMIGKQCYVAPEQLRGDANQRSDIYSFGCTLYYLLTGRDPIALSQSSPAKVMDCSDELDKLVQDCTNFDEQNRPQSFEEVLGRLKNLDRGIRLKLAVPKSKVHA